MSTGTITRLVPSSEQIQRIPLHLIRESVVTLRANYDEASLAELGESLVEQGQLQTIVVQPGGGGPETFDLVIGSRRLRAAKHKGMPDIAAFVIEPRSPVQVLFIALAENLHRADLNPFEEAQVFLRLMKEYELNTGEIAKGIDKPEGYVRGRLQLLSMPEEVITHVSEGRLGAQHVRPLARLPSGEDQVAFAELAIANNLTEPELRREIAREMNEPTRRSPRSPNELTAVKVRARFGDFTEWLGRVPRRMNLRRLNAQERRIVFMAIQSLDAQMRTFKEALQGIEGSSATFAAALQKKPADPKNHRDQWTTGDLKRIVATDRPSDEELSVQLGRSVDAIRTMRVQMLQK